MEGSEVQGLVAAAERMRAGAASIVATAVGTISNLQEMCPHEMLFHHQTNAHHRNRWNIFRRCTYCDFAQCEYSVPPVCRVCGSELRRAALTGVGGAEAAVYLAKHGQSESFTNKPEVWRCPDTTCGELHTLTVLGD